MKTKATWCDECKLKVYDCAHLSGRDAAPEVPDDLPRDPSKRALVFLAFNSEVAAFSTCALRVDPQLVVKPRRLVVDPLIANDFMLIDIKIGSMSQFAAWGGGGVSTAIFPPTPPRYEPIANLSGLPQVQIGQHLILLLMNRSSCSREFNALVWCDTSEG